MATRIFVHGSGQRAASWQATLAHMTPTADIACPNLADLLGGKPPSYENLCAAFARYCDRAGDSVHLCGLSLGGILALAYALDYPQKVASLVLIGTPYKIPRLTFALQQIVFRILPASAFATMAFDKAGTFALGKSMEELDFSARLHEIRCSTLILCGEKDRANLKAAQCLAERIPHAECKVLKNTGHVVNEENPAALAKILNDFYALHP